MSARDKKGRFIGWGNHYYKSREWLYQKYINEKLTILQIANFVGVSGTTIYEWLKNSGVEITNRGKFKRGNKLNLGRQLSMEIREKISKSRIGILAGDKHYNWKGGISKLPYSFEFNNELKKQIKKRDNFICQKCGVHESRLKRKLCVHHIDYDKQNCNSNNLLSLCTSCHFKVNFKREYWTNYFQNLIMEV